MITATLNHTKCNPGECTLANPSCSRKRPLLRQALNDLAEVADAGGCAAMEVVLDRRVHGTQSLLLPGLAATQGAALCIRIPGLHALYPHATPLVHQALAESELPMVRVCAKPVTQASVLHAQPLMPFSLLQ